MLTTTSLSTCLSASFLLYTILEEKNDNMSFVNIAEEPLFHSPPLFTTAIVLQAIKPDSIISSVIEGCGCEDLTRRW